MVHKTFAAKIMDVSKVAPSEPGGATVGKFRAMVSAYGNVDLYGDVVEPDAFTRTLAEWTLKGTPIPCVWAHQFHNLDAILGKFVEVENTEKGLILEAEMDLRHGPSARAHQLMEQGIVTEFSWSGEVRAYEWLETDEDSYWPGMKILDVDLWEAGPCFKGANPETELISVKSTGEVSGILATKNGRVLAGAHVERLKSARDLINEVLDAAEPKPQEDAEGWEAEPVETKTAPEPAKADEGAAETSQPDDQVVDPFVRAVLGQFN